MALAATPAFAEEDTVQESRHAGDDVENAAKPPRKKSDLVKKKSDLIRENMTLKMELDSLREELAKLQDEMQTLDSMEVELLDVYDENEDKLAAGMTPEKYDADVSDSLLNIWYLQQKIAEARTRIAGIARSVQRHERVWDVHEGSVPWLKTYIANPLFVRFVIRSKGFHVEEGCTGCGVCAHSCPVGNIRLEDDRPVWNSHCIHCMACVHGCTQKAIQYGKTTQRKGRYRLKDYL